MLVAHPPRAREGHGEAMSPLVTAAGPVPQPPWPAPVPSTALGAKLEAVTPCAAGPPSCWILLEKSRWRNHLKVEKAEAFTHRFYSG